MWLLGLLSAAEDAGDHPNIRGTLHPKDHLLGFYAPKHQLKLSSARGVVHCRPGVGVQGGVGCAALTSCTERMGPEGEYPNLTGCTWTLDTKLCSTTGVVHFQGRMHAQGVSGLYSPHIYRARRAAETKGLSAEILQCTPVELYLRPVQVLWCPRSDHPWAPIGTSARPPCLSNPAVCECTQSALLS